MFLGVDHINFPSEVEGRYQSITGNDMGQPPQFSNETPSPYHSTEQLSINLNVPIQNVAP